MNEALRVWAPLYDRLVGLWADTVEGDLPRVVANATGGAVTGGWPCKVWPGDWTDRRTAWLNDYRAACESNSLCGKHRHPKSNFRRLQAALVACEQDSSSLNGRKVGWIRRALANTLTGHGLPGSQQRAGLRADQESVASRPSNVELAYVVAGRLEGFPSEGGLPALDSLEAPVAEGESTHVPAGFPVPDHLVGKAARALEAPIDELVERGIIGSSEVLAIVLPQITAQVAAAGIAEPTLRGLYGQVYAAFRRRRSLLLLNLEHQVQIEELPWVAALDSFRSDSVSARDQARQTLEQVTLLALASFPQTILPNPLVREMSSLAKNAGLELPLLQEIAADIFMGRFATKWRDAAGIASVNLEGSIYARYYDLPEPSTWAGGELVAKAKRRRGKTAADEFGSLCEKRSQEAGKATPNRWGGRSVASNGAIIEQSQILTTHNLTVLISKLELGDQLRTLAPSLAEEAFAWIVRRQTQKIDPWKARLQMMKNTAYAWRQALFFLSLCSDEEQGKAVSKLEELVASQDPEWRELFAPAVKGISWVAAGNRFDTDGYGGHHQDDIAKRFLGWSLGRHWLMPADNDAGDAKR